jgi:hypothetical protein
VPLSTFHNRSKGTNPHPVAYENTLTPEVKKALENYIVQLDEWGHLLKASHVRQYGGGQKLGRNWVSKFFNRHLNIVSRFAQRLD